MEKITVSLEIAKALNKAGWEKETQLGWYSLDGVEQVQPKFMFKIDYPYETGWHTMAFLADAPTASEIAEILPEWLLVEKISGLYRVGVEGKDMKPIRDDTMADALAELWLELRREA